MTSIRLSPHHASPHQDKIHSYSLPKAGKAGAVVPSHEYWTIKSDSEVLLSRIVVPSGALIENENLTGPPI